VLLQRQLLEDRLGDVVVATPVRGPLGVSLLVEAGMTATNGSPSSRAKYASLTAVDPLDASMTVVPSLIQPLQSA
jgi:hypothetical protein